jgi:hypothetical protein
MPFQLKVSFLALKYPYIEGGGGELQVMKLYSIKKEYNKIWEYISGTLLDVWAKQGHNLNI